MDSFSVAKKVFYDFLTGNDTDSERLFNYLQAEYSLDSDRLKIVKTHLTRFFFPQFNQNWKRYFTVKSKFEKKYSQWLDSEFVIDFSSLKGYAGRKCSTESFEDTSFAISRQTNVYMYLYLLLVPPYWPKIFCIGGIKFEKTIST